MKYMKFLLLAAGLMISAPAQASDQSEGEISPAEVELEERIYKRDKETRRKDHRNQVRLGIKEHHRKKMEKQKAARLKKKEGRTGKGKNSAQK